MASIQSKVSEIYSLEQLSGKHTCVHALHPSVKIASTFVFIVTVASLGKYDFERLAPYAFYPAIMMALAEIPYSLMLKRAMLAMPFCLFVGLSNVVLDRAPMLILYGVVVSRGIVFLFTLVFRTLLCVVGVLILVSVTPFTELTAQMRRMKTPQLFMTLLEMTYRYVGALIEEATSMYTAYQLRGNSDKGLQMKHMGSFVGQLLLRSFDRAERVYSAMKCRGYALKDGCVISAPMKTADYCFLAITCGLSLLLRFVNIPGGLSRWIGTVLL
ncbi:MAG: cobalt ECF transporter T component CbiQ [Clostridia bacterium]|nr:cobalt ECF transporter T component CbiQ [Clostridia bacterium]